MQKNQNLLGRVVELSIDTRLKSDVKQELSGVENEIHQLEKLKSNLFRLEENARQEIEKKLEELLKQKKRLEGYGKHSEKYKLFPMEVFQWRDKNGWPKLAIFSLESHLCSLGINCLENERTKEKSFYRESTPEYGNLPTEIFNLFDDVFEKLTQAEGLKPGLTHSITMEFAGTVPDDTRLKILEVKKDFEKIFIVTEASWKEKMEPRKDPLVIGWDGANCWLIVFFNTTVLEERIRKEFVV